jgi:hypothetical protein
LGSTYYALVSVSITTNGRPTLINASGDANSRIFTFGGQLQIFRDGTGTTPGSVFTGGVALGAPTYYNGSTRDETQAYSLTTIDSPLTAGPHTYTLVSIFREGEPQDFGKVNGASMLVLEIASAVGPTGAGIQGNTGPTGPAGDPSQWATYPAAANVNLSTFSLSNSSNFTISGNNITGLSNINGQALTDLGGVNWATFRAVQDVDMSGNDLLNWTQLSNTSGLDISGNNISGLSNINGQPLTDLGGVNWATFRAVQNVDMSSNALTGWSRLCNTTGIDISGTAINVQTVNLTKLVSISTDPYALGGGTATTYIDGSGNTWAVHKFDVSGSYTFSNGGTITGAQLLVLGGGGGGGGNYGGGGGAGGAVFVSNITIPSSSYTITVGQGGAAGTSSSAGFSGSNSSITISGTTYTGQGGGYGGYPPGPSNVGGNGGCGGGGGNGGWLGGTGTQGFNGGQGIGGQGGGAGGGMGAAGASGASAVGGGIGIQYAITGSNVYYAGGGGGGNLSGSPGGAGGGGSWNQFTNTATSGTDGLGGGGAGAGAGGYIPGRGGCGTVIIAYPLIQFGSSYIPFGNVTMNALDLELNSTSNVRIQKPLEYRNITSNVSTSSISLSSNYFSTVYRITSNVFNTVSVPSLTSNQAGAFWTLINTTPFDISFSVTGTTDILSPATIYTGSTYNIRWNGSNYFAVQDTQPTLPSTDNTMVIISTSGTNGAFTKSFLTNDGINWSSNLIGSGIYANGILWTGQYWYFITSGAEGRSSDGSAWTITGTGNTFTIGGAAWNGNLLVKASNTFAAYSYDASNWTVVSNSNVASNAYLINLVWGKDKFVGTLFAGGGLANQFVYSYDGITWYGGGYPFGFGGSPNSIAYNGDYFIALNCGANRVAKSTDGITWTVSALNASFNTTWPYVGVAWNGNTWVATNQGGGTANSIFTSSDGTTWTARSQSFIPGNMWDVTWNGSAFYAVGVSNTSCIVIRSANGTNWSFMSNIDTNPNGSFMMRIASRKTNITLTNPALWSLTTPISNVNMNNYGLSNTRNVVISRYLGNYFNLSTISNLYAWYDATDINGDGTAYANGTIVTSWRDKSGSGRHLTGSGSNIIAYDYSRPAVLFNGTAMSNTSLTSFNSTGYNGYIVFALAPTVSNYEAFTLGPTGFRLLLDGSGSKPGGVGFGRFITSNSATTTTITFPAADSSNAIPFHVLSFLQNSNGTVSTFVNGSNNGSNTTTFTTSSNITNFTINTGTIPNGLYVSEVILYNAVDSSPSSYARKEIEGYLAWKYGLQSRLVSGHPSSNSPPGSIPNFRTIGNITSDGSTNSLVISAPVARFQTNIDLSFNIISNIGKIVDASGSATAPSYTFTSDLSTGIHYNGNSQFAIDSSGQTVALFDTSVIRLQEPTEYRFITSDVTGTSLTLSSNYFSTLYRITNTGFSTLTIPSLTAAQTGAFWKLSNTTTSNLSVIVAGTLDIGSPLTLASKSTATIFWNGISNYYLTEATTSNWSQYPAIQNVDIAGYTVSNVASNIYARAVSGTDGNTGGTLNTFTSNGFAYSSRRFTTSGTFTVTGGSVNAEILVVGGGGGGGGAYGGGGGGGGLVYVSNVTLPVGTYTITVGAGGVGGSNYGDAGTGVGSSGSNSVFTNNTTITYTGLGGGGGGAAFNTTSNMNGLSGGNGGGGGGRYNGPGGLGGSGTQPYVSPQSPAGTAGAALVSGAASGGGGGMGGGGTGHTGGLGLAFTLIDGVTSNYYSGGGGGGNWTDFGLGNGGLGSNFGGGGDGKSGSGQTGGSGVANTGGGGGGGSADNARGGAGGSGVVILTYQPAGTLYNMGTITTDASYNLVINPSNAYNSSSNLRITGNLGVGTAVNASYTYPFDVSGSGRLSNVITGNGLARAPAYTFTSDLSTGIHYNGNSQLAFDTSGIARVIIDNSGINLSNNLLYNWSRLSNSYGLDICGTDIGGLSTINGISVSSLGGGGSPSNWAQYSAVQNVDMSGYVLSNSSGFDISGNNLSGVSNINGNALSTYQASNWAQYYAVQHVDLSGYTLSNSSGFDISGNNISGLSNINKNALSTYQASNWAQYAAVQNVDMSSNALLQWSQISNSSGIDISGTNAAGFSNITTNNLVVNGILTTTATQEVVNTLPAPTATQVVDWTTGAIFYVTGMTADWTPNITNLPTTANRSYVVSFVLIQGSTPYMITALQIAGSAVGISWVNAAPPSGTSNRTEIVSFVLIYTGTSWVALGNFTSYG